MLLAFVLVLVGDLLMKQYTQIWNQLSKFLKMNLYDFRYFKIRVTFPHISAALNK